MTFITSLHYPASLVVVTNSSQGRTDTQPRHCRAFLKNSFKCYDDFYHSLGIQKDFKGSLALFLRAQIVSPRSLIRGMIRFNSCELIIFLFSETQIEALQAELEASRLLQEQVEAQSAKLLELEQALAQRETQTSVVQEVSCFLLPSPLRMEFVPAMFPFEFLE